MLKHKYSALFVIFFFSKALYPVEIPQGFEAVFEQRIITPKKKQITYKGKVRFTKQTGQLYWRYESPNHQEVCTDKERITVVDHDLEQVSYFALKKGLSLQTILQNAKAYPGKPNLYTAKADGKTYTIKLDRNKKLHSVAYFDELDNKVQILFLNVRYLRNPLPAKKLLCTIPKHYDLIR